MHIHVHMYTFRYTCIRLHIRICIYIYTYSCCHKQYATQENLESYLHRFAKDRCTQLTVWKNCTTDLRTFYRCALRNILSCMSRKFSKVGLTHVIIWDQYRADFWELVPGVHSGIFGAIPAWRFQIWHAALCDSHISESDESVSGIHYQMAMMCRLLKIIGLFCRISSLL